MRSFPGKAQLRPWVLAARRARRHEWSRFDLAFARPSYSQFGEDLIVLGLHARAGLSGVFVQRSSIPSR